MRHPCVGDCERRCIGHDWQKTGRSSAKSAPRERALARIAGNQKHLVTVGQAELVGIPAATLRSRAQSGRVHRLHAGVYSLAPPPFSRWQQWLAGVLACGPGALLSDLPAALVLGLAGQAPATPHVTVPSGRGRSREHIVVHRRRIESGDASMRDGIPCTSAARTVFDLAQSLPFDELERMLILADSLRILNRRRLEELVTQGLRRPGTAQLREFMVGEPARVRSQVEARFLSLCRRAGMPEPRVNTRIAVSGKALEVDFCWPEPRIIVEIDGYAFHGGRARANQDRDREQLLAIAGWRVHRFTADQVRDEPAETMRRLKLLLGAGTSDDQRSTDSGPGECGSRQIG